MGGSRDEWLLHQLAEILVEETDVEEPLTEEDLERINWKDIVRDLMDELPSEIAQSYKNPGDDYDEFIEQRNDFRERLQDRWEEPIELLRKFIFASQGLGSEINSHYRSDAAKEDDYLFDSLTRLHARAVMVSQEIIRLLESGFADGALARWRTLHEIAVVSYFISEKGEETAERFLNYSKLENFYLAQDYRKYDDKLSLQEVSDDPLSDLEDIKDDLVEEYGSQFDDGGFGYGWAKNNFSKNSVGMSTLEEEVGLDHYEPYTELANESVHADSRGTLNKLGMLNLPDYPNRPGILSGPSNAGLSQPGQLTAISLQQVNSALVDSYDSVTDRITLSALQELVDEANQKFADCEIKLEEDEREALKEWSNMDIPQIAEKYVGPEKIFTDDFIQENTSFQSAEALVEELSDIDNISDISIEEGEVDQLVSENTSFDSVKDFFESAFANWVEKNVDE